MTPTPRTTSPRARRTRSATTADAPARHLTEAQFQAQIVQAATLLGWKVYHPWLSVHSTAGYPDLTMVRGSRVIFAEIKSGHGKLSAAQSAWLHALGAAGQEVFLWYPVSWPQIEKVLAR